VRPLAEALEAELDGKFEHALAVLLEREDAGTAEDRITVTLNVADVLSKMARHDEAAEWFAHAGRLYIALADEEDDGDEEEALVGAALDCLKRAVLAAHEDEELQARYAAEYLDAFSDAWEEDLEVDDHLLFAATLYRRAGRHALAGRAYKQLAIELENLAEDEDDPDLDEESRGVWALAAAEYEAAGLAEEAEDIRVSREVAPARPAKEPEPVEPRH